MNRDFKAGKIWFAGEELEYNSEKSIQDCGLQNNGHVYMVVRVKGGNFVIHWLFGINQTLLSLKWQQLPSFCF